MGVLKLQNLADIFILPDWPTIPVLIELVLGSESESILESIPESKSESEWRYFGLVCVGLPVSVRVGHPKADLFK